jgi:DnaA-homolog protein
MNQSQLPLQLRFPAERRFDSFEPVQAPAVAGLRACAEGGDARAFVAGPPGSGKTHLLQAACAHAAEHGRSIGYLPLAVLQEHAPAALQAQAAVDLLCIDGVEAIAGDAAGELALFVLANRQQDAGGAIVYAAPQGPEALPLGLPDLRSRLQHATRYLFQPLDESGRRTLLQQRAAQRGLRLDEAVLDYLFRRVGRDLGTLGTLLERIDRESLAAQRRITVPFLRGLLEHGAPPAAD